MQIGRYGLVVIITQHLLHARLDQELFHQLLLHLIAQKKGSRGRRGKKEKAEGERERKRKGKGRESGRGKGRIWKRKVEVELERGNMEMGAERGREGSGKGEKGGNWEGIEVERGKV